MARPTRQPATLSENLDQSNPHWSRDEDLKWVCSIDGCGRAFDRKALLVFHRGRIHHLSEYERNIPDQRLSFPYGSPIRGSQGLASRINSQLVELSSDEILDIVARAIPKRPSGAENTTTGRLFFEGVTILLERLLREDTGAPQPPETQVIENAEEPLDTVLLAC